MAVAFDAASNSGDVSGTSGATFAHTVGAGADRIICVAVMVRDPTAGNTVVSSVTYGGVALTQAVRATNAPSYTQASEIWALATPASGSANVVVTMAGTCERLAAAAVSATGVVQTATPHTTNTGSGNGTAPSVAATTTQPCFVMSAIYDNESPASFAINTGGGHTNIAEIDVLAGSDVADAGYIAQTVAGTATAAWSSSTTQQWASVVAAFAAAGIPVKTLAALGVG